MEAPGEERGWQGKGDVNSDGFGPGNTRRVALLLRLLPASPRSATETKMCRWFTYIGDEPQLLEDVLLRPTHSIVKQSLSNSALVSSQHHH